MKKNIPEKPRHSRRDFLKKGAILGSASLAAPAAFASMDNSNSSAFSLPESKDNFFDSFRRRGPEVVYADDVRYPSLLLGSNSRFTSTPDYINVCSNSHEVYQAVKKAFNKGKRITVRSGGHCYENFFQNDGGVIVDLGNMRKIYRTNGYYVVEAGVNIGGLYEHLFKEYGVTIPAGSCFTVGMGGHICGGGFGVQSRNLGLTVDYLEGIELISFNRRNGKPGRPKVYLKSNGGHEADVVWAHQGGGGGNFGIVTKYIFKNLPTAQSHVVFSSTRLEWADLSYTDFSELLKAYGNFFAENNSPTSPYNGIHSSLNLNPRSGGAGGINFSVTYRGDQPERLNDFYDSLYLATGIDQLSSQNMSQEYFPAPWWLATQYLGGSPGSARGKNKSAYMNETFPDSQTEKLWNLFNNDNYPNPGAALQISSYGGKINAVNSDTTAVSHRQSVLKLQYQTYWFSPAQDDFHLGWIRQVYNTMYGTEGPVSDGLMDGCYVNYPDRDLQNWQTLYYKDNYAGLQEIKSKLDPENQLNHAQSIELFG